MPCHHELRSLKVASMFKFQANIHIVMSAMLVIHSSYSQKTVLYTIFKYTKLDVLIISLSPSTLLNCNFPLQNYPLEPYLQVTVFYEHSFAIISLSTGQKDLQLILSKNNIVASLWMNYRGLESLICNIHKGQSIQPFPSSMFRNPSGQLYRTWL